MIGRIAEIGGRLHVEGSRPLQRDPTRPIQIDVTHLTELKPERVRGFARLVGCTVGLAGRDQTFGRLEFSCLAKDEWSVTFGVDEIDHDRGTNLIETWFVQCLVPPNAFQQLFTATTVTIVCTADMWASGSDWKLAPRQFGKGTITQFRPK
jgi:hypothetical protein